MSDGLTKYSDAIKGDRGNYEWPARFDLTDGYLGVTQNGGDDRVLLSPGQVTKLLEFLGRPKRR